MQFPKKVFIVYNRYKLLKEKNMENLYLKPNDSLSEALGRVKPHTRIILGEGDYREKIEISVPDIEIIGQGAGKTRIIYDDYAKKLDEQGREYVTFRTYTTRKRSRIKRSEVPLP